MTESQVNCSPGPALSVNQEKQPTQVLIKNKKVKGKFAWENAQLEQ